MLSTADFVQKYESYTDEELHAVYLNQAGYSDEAIKALEIVLENKGGLDALLKRLEEKHIVEKEIHRIRKETAELGSKGIDSSFIKSTTASGILSPEKVNEIIDSQYAEVERALDDKRIKPRTIAGSIIGGLTASIIGGILWGLQMIYSNRIFYILGIGLALLCYGIIKLATRQSKNNIVVLVASIISIALAVFFGEMLYAIYGYQG